MLLIWGFAFILIAAYYFVPVFGSYFALLEDWHIRFGLWAVIADRILFCGLVPAVFMLTIKGLREPRVWVVCLLLTIWNLIWGIVCDVGFRLQAFLFGSDSDWGTLLMKTCVDQFVFAPLVIAPANAMFCFWLARDLSFVRVRREWPKRTYKDLVVPNLFANWLIAIPVTFIMFSFPTPLQIHINSLCCSFAALLFLQIGRRTH